MKITETKEKTYLSDKLTEWANNHRKLIRRILAVSYIILVIIFSIITVNMSGGIKEFQDILNRYPEQEYQQLEQELKNIIVECDGIYPEKLSKDYIIYDISYNESNNFEGTYEIKLTDSVTVTATIGKDLKKEDLIIKRKYKTESEYRRSQYILTIGGLIILPIFPFLCLILIIYLLLSLLLLIIELPFRLYYSHTAKKN